MKDIGQKIVVINHKECFAAVESGNFSGLRLMELIVAEERADVPGDEQPNDLHKGYRATGRIPGDAADTSFGCQWQQFSDSSTQPYHTWCLIPADVNRPTEHEVDNYLWAEASLLAGRVDDTKMFADYVNTLFPHTLDHCIRCVETPNAPREFSTDRMNCWFCKAAERPATAGTPGKAG